MSVNNRRPRAVIPALATAEELVGEIGKFIRLRRVARGLGVDDLSKASQTSVEEIELIESGQGGDLVAFVRIAQVLHFEEALVNACRPLPVSLDKIERMEEELSRGAP